MQLLIKLAMVEIFTANFLKVIGSVIDVQFSIKINPSFAQILNASFVEILMALWNVLIKRIQCGLMLSVLTGIPTFTLLMMSKRPALEVNWIRGASSFCVSAARNQELVHAFSATHQIAVVPTMLDAQFVAMLYRNGKRWRVSLVTLNWKIIISFPSSAASIERMATKTLLRNKVKKRRWNQRVRKI